ncbi:PREDICTED: irregular chiasm C-roughest protein [Bactrocera latifrons]|uniref:irregular chiasm C-roughest protein n=1 Tax=Bactrocera latifrons TaxID=174628 RepID=UPI0008DD9C88|nr:PREDICTED: irregular chiasm C-roughest protein [Bactrocera latifrons]XP_018796594.1 PREDICTED: irregular chiasm C-roughest protein [Bactrocera latifrons]
MSISIKRTYFALTSHPRSTLDSRSANNNSNGSKDSNCKCAASQRTHPHKYQCHHKHIPHTAHWCCTATRPGFFSILLMSLLLFSAHWHSVEAKPKSRKSSNSHHSNDEKSPTEGQRFAMEPQDQTAVVGSRVTLPCRVMGKMGALQWTKDDFGLGQHRNLSGFERYSMVGSDEEGDFSLDIYPVMLDDDAKYQCQVGPGPAGEAGIRSRFAELTVLVPPEAPKITQGEVIFTTEDREIELECVSAGGKPAAEITWIDGLGNVLTKGIEYVKEPLSDSRRITAKSILKLVPKKEHHNTTFTCQAQNTADRTYRAAKILIEVKYAPKVVVSVISGALAGGRILEGSEVILSCQADANPPAQSYRWFINEELVTGDYTTKMIIHNVTRHHHEALVKCEVVNAVGKSEETETLDISYAPIFKHRPISVEADLDTNANLLCDVDGNPTPEIEWINENTDKVVGNTANLNLKVTTETAGRYYCKAIVTGFPEIGAEATIYVKRAPIITSHKVQFGAVGSRAKIDCVAFSVPKAEQILWSFEDKVINMSTADPDIYIFEEQHLPEGVRAALIIKESRSSHFGRYNCTVKNSYGSDSLLINLKPEPGSVPILLVVMGSLSSVAIVIMIVMLVIVYMKRNNKKPIPADVIPEASRGGDKLSGLKHELRAKAYDVDYSEAGSDGLAINLTQAPMPDVQMKGATLGVPLAGPVKLDDRFSGDFSYSRQCHIKNLKNQDYKETVNGYAPYFEYALDYSAPTEGGKPGAGVANNVNKSQTSTINSATLPHYTNPVTTTGNLSLPRNRNDMQQQPQQSTAQMGNGFLAGQSLLQNGIDSRFSAIYGNPYLRSNSSLLPPLPPPSTANPAATPAPPPYQRHHHHPSQQHVNMNGGIGVNALKNYSALTAGIGMTGANSNGGAGSISGSSSNLTASSNTLAAMTPLTQGAPLTTATPVTTTAPVSVAVAQSPSGQFILPSNGSAKQGALATHV